MDMAGVVAAADSPYAIIAIALIGLYALGWRWGGKMLDQMTRNTRLTEEAKTVAVEAKQKVAKVQESIVTNHGSKNLGDAVDRLTTWLLEHIEDSKHGHEQLRTLQQVVVASAIETDQVRADFTERLVGIDDILEAVQHRLALIEQKKNDSPETT
jgi:hypothetical protein